MFRHMLNKKAVSVSAKPVNQELRKAIDFAATEASNLPDKGENYAKRLAAEFILGRIETSHKFESQRGFSEIETREKAIDAVGEWVTWLTNEVIEKEYKYGKHISDAVYEVLRTDRMYALVGNWLPYGRRVVVGGYIRMN